MTEWAVFYEMAGEDGEPVWVHDVIDSGDPVRHRNMLVSLGHDEARLMRWTCNGWENDESGPHPEG